MIPKSLQISIMVKDCWRKMPTAHPAIIISEQVLKDCKASFMSCFENVSCILPPDEKVEKTFPVTRGRTWAILGKFSNAEFVLDL